MPAQAIQPRPANAPRGADADLETTLRRMAVRRRILAVAKHRFARFGYEHVSMQDVARGADVDWQDFLLYFEDKPSLLTAILDEGWNELMPRLSDAIFNSITAHSAMLSVLALMTNTMQRDEDLVRLLLFEGRRPDPDSAEIGYTGGYRRFLQLCRDLVVRGQRDGSFRPTYHPQVVASMLVGALEGMLRDRLVAEQDQGMTPYTGTYLISAFDALVSCLKA